MDLVILRFGEIGTKGKNRIDFINNLLRNIKQIFLRDAGKKVEVVSDRSRIYLKTDLPEDIVRENLKKIFGIASYSFAYVVDLNVDLIRRKIVEVLKTDPNIKNKKMRVSVNRIEKNLYESPKLQADIGSYVEERIGMEVDYVNYDIEISVEIRDKAYIYFEKILGLGGLPVQIEGRVLCLIDSQEAFYVGYGMMKRGCEIFPVFFEENSTDSNKDNKHKIKSKFDLEDAEEVVEKLRKYSPNNLVLNKISKINIKDFAGSRQCIAIAVADTLESVREYGFPTLRPCIVEF